MLYNSHNSNCYNFIVSEILTNVTLVLSIHAITYEILNIFLFFDEILMNNFLFFHEIS